MSEDRLGIKVVFTAGNRELPRRLSLLPTQCSEHVQGFENSLVDRPATEIDELGLQCARCSVFELLDVDAVLDHLEPGMCRYTTKNVTVVFAGGDDPPITLRRHPGDATEVDLFESLCEFGVKKPAVGRSDQRFAVKLARQGEIIERKINAMYMDQINVTQRVQDFRAERITLRTAVRQTLDRNAVQRFLRRQALIRLAKHPVEGDNTWLVARLALLVLNKVANDLFHATDGGQILTNNVSDFHA